MTALDDLADALRAEGGLLVDDLLEPPAPDAVGDVAVEQAAGGPRALEDASAYALVLAAVREGYLLHYDEGRVVRPRDPDLALLGGDRLFALGLARLAEVGDLAAVAELADLISLCAQAHASVHEADGARELADAAWAAAGTAIGHGAAPAHVRAKELARAGAVDGAASLRAAALPAERS
ncbi:MAG TPA: hypothetical protein VGM91_18540 [Conexibacter sp.]